MDSSRTEVVLMRSSQCTWFTEESYDFARSMFIVVLGFPAVFGGFQRCSSCGGAKSVNVPKTTYEKVAEVYRRTKLKLKITRFSRGKRSHI